MDKVRQAVVDARASASRLFEMTLLAEAITEQTYPARFHCALQELDDRFDAVTRALASLEEDTDEHG
jgi:hypothetical protein